MHGTTLQSFHDLDEMASDEEELDLIVPHRGRSRSGGDIISPYKRGRGGGDDYDSTSDYSSRSSRSRSRSRSRSPSPSASVRSIPYEESDDGLDNYDYYDDCCGG